MANTPDTTSDSRSPDGNPGGSSDRTPPFVSGVKGFSDPELARSFKNGKVRAAVTRARKLRKNDSSFSGICEVLVGLEDGLDRLNRLIKGGEVLNQTEAQMAIEQSDQLIQRAKGINMNPAEFVSLQGILQLRLQEIRATSMLRSRPGDRAVGLPQKATGRKGPQAILDVLAVILVIGLIVVVLGGAYYLLFVRSNVGTEWVGKILSPEPEPTPVLVVPAPVDTPVPIPVEEIKSPPTPPAARRSRPIPQGIDEVLRQEQMRVREAMSPETPVARASPDRSAERTAIVREDNVRPHVVPTPARLAEIEREMVRFEGGSFVMGDASGQYLDAQPKWVQVDPFYLDKHEVTNAQYTKFLEYIEATADHSKCHEAEPPFRHVPGTDLDLWLRRLQGKEDHPVVHINWFDAYAYASWAGKRLPLEAEWEFAVRGGGSRGYPWGNTGPDASLANCAFPGSELRTTPVGSYPDGRSPEGLYDLAGNVWEWCWDAFEETPFRVFRGGSFATVPVHLNPTFRGRDFPDGRSNFTGLRCAMNAE